jgi:large subunit ribosomal protein L18
MDKQRIKSVRRVRRCRGIRKRVAGTPQRPRLAVYRSLQHVYAQIIDDMAGHTLCAASSAEVRTGAAKGKRGLAAEVGKALAAKAAAAGIREVVFDRGGFRYHGRIKALADGAREGGLKF